MKAILTNSILALLLCIGVDSSSARIINVPDDEESIQAGIDAAQDGDTVLVHPGVYNEHIDFQGKAIVLESTDGPEETIINGGENGPCVRFTNGEGRGSQLVGFILNNGRATGDGYGGGILIERSSPTIEGNIIAYNRAQEGGGGLSVSFDGCNPLIIRNLIVENSTPGGGGGVSFYQCAGEFINNTVVGNSAEQGAGGVNIPFTDGVILTNNIVVGNSGGGIAGWEVENPALTYNDVWNNQGGDYSNVEAGEGSISEDPAFVEPGGEDKHLTEDSPCIDAGDPASDHDPDGTIADMGAFYFHLFPEIAADALELLFGPVNYNESDFQSLLILNEGRGILLIDEIYLSQESTFRIDTLPPLPIQLALGDSLTLLIEFSPNVDEPNSAELHFLSNDPDVPDLSIELIGEVLSVEDEILHPAAFTLSAHPNPFNASASIRYDLPVAGEAALRLYDLSGREVCTLFERQLRVAGSYSTMFDGSDLTAGVYLLRLETGIESQAKKVLLLK